MSKKIFFVQCGNWCLKLNIDSSMFDNKSEIYSELGTRALETIFSSKDFSDENDDYYAILNDDGVNVLSLDEDDNLPEPSFTTNTHILSSKGNEPHKLIATLKTSELFANASQFDNYKFALEAEKLESESNNKPKKKSKKK